MIKLSRALHAVTIGCNRVLLKETYAESTPRIEISYPLLPDVIPLARDPLVLASNTVYGLPLLAKLEPMAIVQNDFLSHPRTRWSSQRFRGGITKWTESATRRFPFRHRLGEMGSESSR